MKSIDKLKCLALDGLCGRTENHHSWNCKSCPAAKDLNCITFDKTPFERQEWAKEQLKKQGAK